MAAISRLKAGQIVWDLQRKKAGNTSTKLDCLYQVKIIEVHLESSFVIASWNGNSPKRFNEKSVKKWRVVKPASKGKDAFGRNYYQ